jgi:hypothetical protein
MVKVGWKVNDQTIYYNNHSDAVYGYVRIITGTWNTPVLEDRILCTNISLSPQQSISFNSVIEQTFNNARYAIP